MVSVFTHAVVALSLGAIVRPRERPVRFLGLSVACSTLPDADVIGFRFGVPYGDLLGHRGLSHSLLFALVLGLLVALLFYRDLSPRSSRFWRTAAWFAFITASHGVIDAMTDGGLGIAFFSPIDTTRYFLPLRPIEVSPIGIERFFSARGWSVLWSEIRWVWGPVLSLGLLGTMLRRR